MFVIAACGLVYQLVAGAVSSYLFGDPVTQFSLVVGVFLSAMGIGAYLAKFVTRRLVATFVEVEIAIGCVGGVSSIAMFAANALIEPFFDPFFYSLYIVLGVLVGIEVPLLVRILESGEGGFRSALSHVLALDYMGALAGALLFPFLALPFLGLSRASVVFGIMNLGVAAAGLRLIDGPRRGTTLRLVAASAVLVCALIGSTRLVNFFEDLIYQDSVVYAHQSSHQRIILTRWQDDVRLYLNGHIQFSSIDEARYHEALVLPAMEAAPQPRHVLILGGGDGLAAREVLKYPSVERLTLVDLDPAVTELARSRRELLRLNKGSLDAPGVSVIHADAMTYLREDDTFYEVVIVDLPDPHSPSLSKLYSTAFYALIARRLSLGGVMVTQASSPYYAPKAFWCIEKSIAGAIPSEHPAGPLLTVPYHFHVPSFGDWGFVMASRARIDGASLEPSVATRVLDAESLRAMLVFPRDMPKQDVELNRLEDPVLYRYYRQGWERFNE